MATQLDYPGDMNVRVNGTFSARNIAYPAGQIDNAAIKSGAAIEATKLIHQHALKYPQAGGSDVVSATVPIHTFRSAATIVAVEVVPLVAPAGGDKQYTVDVQLGSAGSAFATILAAPVTVDDAGSADRTPQTGSLTTLAAADGDTLQVVVTASGATGTQGQGLLVTVWVREDP